MERIGLLGGDGEFLLGDNDDDDCFCNAIVVVVLLLLSS